jgi:hypothetical protein
MSVQWLGEGSRDDAAHQIVLGLVLVLEEFWFRPKLMNDQELNFGDASADRLIGRRRQIRARARARARKKRPI